MALFFGTFTNKVDRKGRVSVPSRFRDAVIGQSFPGLIVWCSTAADALDGCDMARMEELAAKLDTGDPLGADNDPLKTQVFGGALTLPFDGEGRIILSDSFRQFAAIGESAIFVGMSRTFRIWSPERFEGFVQQHRIQASLGGAATAGGAA